MTHFLSTISLVLLWNQTSGQVNLPGIKAIYQVVADVECANSKGEKMKLKSLSYEGMLFAKNEKFIYLDKATYLDELTSNELSIYVGNEMISTIISTDSIQNIRYANADSGIWRSQLFQGIEGGYQEYYKGFLQRNNWHWKLLPESKDISGLACQRAQMYVGGNLQIDGWFSPDLPINFGPFGMLNLPGLLVEGTDFNSRTHYMLQSYEVTDKIDDGVFWPLELNHTLSQDYTILKKN